MSPHVELHGSRWCVYQDSEEIFASDYRKVEDWLDRAEFSLKYLEPSEEPSHESLMAVQSYVSEPEA